MPETEAVHFLGGVLVGGLSTREARCGPNRVLTARAETQSGTTRTCALRKRTGSTSKVRLGVLAMMALGLRWEPRGSVLGCRAGSIRDHAATRMAMKAPVGAVASVGAAMSKVSG